MKLKLSIQPVAQVVSSKLRYSNSAPTRDVLIILKSCVIMLLNCEVRAHYSSAVYVQSADFKFCLSCIVHLFQRIISKFSSNLGRSIINPYIFNEHQWDCTAYCAVLFKFLEWILFDNNNYNISFIDQLILLNRTILSVLTVARKSPADCSCRIHF